MFCMKIYISIIMFTVGLRQFFIASQEIHASVHRLAYLTNSVFWFLSTITEVTRKAYLILIGHYEDVGMIIRIYGI